jgi:hypothetical protein
MRFLLILLLAACGDNTGGSGKVQVFVAAEDTIPDGLMPGRDLENIQDGWSVRYDKFLIAIGNFRATRSANLGDKLSDPKVYVLDLRNLPTQGFILASFEKVNAVRFDKVGFDLPNTSAASLPGDTTSQADFQLMQQNGYSVYFEATLTRPDGQSCLPSAPADCVPRPSVTVRWGVKAGTSFEDCAAPDSDAGFAVPTSGTVQVKPTIHGDHWFFNNLTQGAEITERLAQWIANCDLDRDGETTIEELKQVDASDALPASAGYNLTGGLIPIETAYDYLEAQARTLGDFQGEGECPTRRFLE